MSTLELTYELALLSKQVNAYDSEINKIIPEIFSQNYMPEWLPPEFGKSIMTVRVPIDYCTKENLANFERRISRLVEARHTIRKQQAKMLAKESELKLHEVVPS